MVRRRGAVRSMFLGACAGIVAVSGACSIGTATSGAAPGDTALDRAATGARSVEGSTTTETATPAPIDDAERATIDKAIDEYLTDCFKGLVVHSVTTPEIRVIGQVTQRLFGAEFEVRYATEAVGDATQHASMSISPEGHWYLYGSASWGPRCSPEHAPDTRGG